MKMLVCVDGSRQSQKAAAEAAKIAGGCNINEVDIIYVHENRISKPLVGDIGVGYAFTQDDLERMKKLDKVEMDKGIDILAKAKEGFPGSNMEVNTILKDGHPASTIIEVANKGDYDMLVIGSRGLGGLEKLFLGSVSSAVLHEVKCSVVVVK